MNHDDLSRRSPRFWAEPSLPGMEHKLLECRVDYDELVGSLSYTIIGRDTPNLERYVDIRSHVYDRSHLGMAPLDFTAHVWGALSAPVDPFP